MEQQDQALQTKQVSLLDKKAAIALIKKGKFEMADLKKMTEGITVKDAREGTSLNQLRAGTGIQTMYTGVAMILKTALESFNVKYGMSDDQIMLFVSEFYELNPFTKIEQLLLMLKKARMGEFEGEIMHTIDSHVLMDWWKQFTEMDMNDAQADHHNQKIERSNWSSNLEGDSGDVVRKVMKSAQQGIERKEEKEKEEQKPVIASRDIYIKQLQEYKEDITDENLQDLQMQMHRSNMPTYDGDVLVSETMRTEIDIVEEELMVRGIFKSYKVRCKEVREKEQKK